MTVSDGSQSKAQVPRARKRTEANVRGEGRGSAAPHPNNSPKHSRPPMDAGCTPRGAFLGADGSIKLDFGADENSSSSGNSWDRVLDP